MKFETLNNFLFQRIFFFVYTQISAFKIQWTNNSEENWKTFSPHSFQIVRLFVWCHGCQPNGHALPSFVRFDISTKHQAPSTFYVESQIVLSLNVFVSVRTMRYEFAVRPPESTVHHVLCVFFFSFFFVWNFRQRYSFFVERIVFDKHELFYPSDSFNRSIHTFAFIHLRKNKKKLIQ